MGKKGEKFEKKLCKIDGFRDDGYGGFRERWDEEMRKMNGYSVKRT